MRNEGGRGKKKGRNPDDLTPVDIMKLMETCPLHLMEANEDEADEEEGPMVLRDAEREAEYIKEVFSNTWPGRWALCHLNQGKQFGG